MVKRVLETPLTGKTKEGDILSEQEERFCYEYTTNYNRIDAVLAAYNVDKTKPSWKNTASSIASENLLKPHILRRIREMLDQYHLNDETVDNELSFLMRQCEDLPSKKGAIEIYNKLKNRYEKHQDAGANKIEFVIKERKTIELENNQSKE